MVLHSFFNNYFESQLCIALKVLCNCATGTYSFGACARAANPGPKFTAGIPRAENLATSVQPNFGCGSPITLSMNC